MNECMGCVCGDISYFRKIMMLQSYNRTLITCAVGVKVGIARGNRDVDELGRGRVGRCQRHVVI